MRKRWYVGYPAFSNPTAFAATDTPTKATHGHLYTFVMGPFRTRRGAHYQAYVAPCTPTVNEAERDAKGSA